MRTTREKQIVDYWVKRLSKHFYIEQEVTGKHFSGKNLRIDAIIRPKDTTNWANKDIAFGVEFKDIEFFKSDFDTKNYTKWMKQCVDYANTYFEGYGYLYILICPSRTPEKYSFSLHLLSQLGVGQIVDSEYLGVTIMLNQTHKIWSEKNGVMEGKRWKLERKFGNG